MDALTLWYTRCPAPTPLGIAAQLNWLEYEFASDGIAVRSLQDVADPKLRQSHQDHTLPNLFRQGGVVPAIYARSLGHATRVLGFTWTDEAQLLLARGDGPLLDPSGLRGKRLGVRVRSGAKIDAWRATTRRAYAAALKVAGLSERDVTFVEIPAPEQHDFSEVARHWPSVEPRELPEVRALLAGEVDVIFHKGSRGVEVERAIGARRIVDLGAHESSSVRSVGALRLLTADADLIERHPRLVVRTLKLVLRAGEWAASHPFAAMSCVVSETGSSELAVRSGYGNQVGEHLRTDFDARAIEALDDCKSFLLAKGWLKSDFSLRDWLAPDPLAQAQQELSAQRERTALGLSSVLGWSNAAPAFHPL
ncbi:MAG: hypothetical protein QM778_30590 [Myxococcales bacterium]